MAEHDIIPQSYGAWRECISVRCGLHLTKQYIDQRLEELGNPSHPKTREFAKHYGEPYLGQIIAWFQTARQEVGG